MRTYDEMHHSIDTPPSSEHDVIKCADEFHYTLNMFQPAFEVIIWRSFLNMLYEFKVVCTVHHIAMCR